MTLAEALRDITQRITCVDWDADENRGDWISPTLERYLVFCSGGIGGRGTLGFPCLCREKDLAVKTWHMAVLRYEAERPGILYWREKPELCPVDITINDGGDGRNLTWWHVYSRLLISDKSVIRTVKRAAVP